MKNLNLSTRIDRRQLTRIQPRWRAIPPQWLFLVVVCLIAGMMFRAVNFEHKVYWNDETYTSLRISGYLEAEAIQSLSQSGLIQPSDLQQYQFPTNPNKTVIDTIRGLASEEPQLTPLYFVAARYWTEWFGDSVAVIRSLSLLGGLLAFPAMGWLCFELFESWFAAGAGMMVLAVSPYQMLYAQEARPIAWWTVATLISSAALLRALRRKTKAGWLTYALSTAFGFYIFLFAGFTAIAQALYVMILERFRLRKTVFALIGALSLATVLFLPWLATVIANSHQAAAATAWSESGRLTLKTIYSTWTHHLVLPFADPYVLEDALSFLPSPLDRMVSALVLWTVRLLVLYAFYALCRQTPQRIWLFVVLLTAIPALTVLSIDLLRGGGVSSNPRYIVPFYLGLQLAVTYLLSVWLFGAVAGARWRTYWLRGMAIVFLLIGFSSCTLNMPVNTGWNKMINKTNPQVAALINQAERPLVISDADLGDLFSLSYLLEPKVRLLVQPQSILGNTSSTQTETPYLPEIPPGFSDVFLYKPRPIDLWLNRLNQQKTYRFETLSEGFDRWFWKLKS